MKREGNERTKKRDPKQSKAKQSKTKYREDDRSKSRFDISDPMWISNINKKTF